MTLYPTRFAAMFLAGAAITAPSVASAPIAGGNAVHSAPRSVSNWTPGQPAYAVEQFRGDRLDRIRTLIAKGEYQKARMALDGNRQQIKSAEGEYLLGVASANLGAYRAASEAFRSSLSLESGHIGASVGAALSELQLGRRDRAEEIARQIDERRASCNNGCSDALALDRASQVLRHFLKQS
nr:hypothetical protein [uncultured Sphingomonas sp.]